MVHVPGLDLLGRHGRLLAEAEGNSQATLAKGFHKELRNGSLLYDRRHYFSCADRDCNSRFDLQSIIQRNCVSYCEGGVFPCKRVTDDPALSGNQGRNGSYDLVRLLSEP